MIGRRPRRISDTPISKCPITSSDEARDGWVPLYNEKDPFHETFVTLGFLAAVTRTIGLATGILIAPQRQTGVIAKQAAEVDLLSGGRLGSASAWDGTTSNMKRSARTGRRGECARPSKSRCSVAFGRKTS